MKTRTLALSLFLVLASDWSLSTAFGQQEKLKEPTRQETSRHERSLRNLVRTLGGNPITTRVANGRYESYAYFGKQADVDPALKHLDGLYNFVSLDLAYTRVTDKGCRALSKLEDLERLMIYGTAVGDEGLKHVSGLTKLSRLQASACTGITDAGVEHLRGLTNLENLSLYGTRITDKSLEILAELPKLRALDVRNTGVTPAAWAKFKADRPFLTEDTEAGIAGAGISAGFGN